jgi:hypothetical protein
VADRDPYRDDNAGNEVDEQNRDRDEVLGRIEASVVLETLRFGHEARIHVDAFWRRRRLR